MIERGHKARAYDLSRQRIGAKLELQNFAGRPSARFHMEWRSGAYRCPDPFALPAGLRIVNPAIHPFGVEPRRIRNAEDHPFPILEGQQSFGRVARVDRRVFPTPHTTRLKFLRSSLLSQFEPTERAGA